MNGIFTYTYIYHKHQPNVGKYTIHGSYGSWGFLLQYCCLLSLFEDFDDDDDDGDDGDDGDGDDYYYVYTWWYW